MDKKQGAAQRAEARAKIKLRNLLSKRINSIIGISLQAVENKIGADNEDYEAIRYSIMKICNDINRKIEVDLESFIINERYYTYNMPFIGGE